MAATFGAPVAAVLLALEFLLFELRERSIIPVALASTMAAAVRCGSRARVCGSDAPRTSTVCKSERRTSESLNMVSQSQNHALEAIPRDSSAIAGS